jgi:large subunit ribosomal protein L7A
MDTKKDLRIPECGDLAKTGTFRFVVGAKQLRKALQSGRARYVYLATDADPAITAPIEEQCLKDQIPFAWIATMRDLGSACGIEVGAAAAAAVD